MCSSVGITSYRAFRVRASCGPVNRYACVTLPLYSCLLHAGAAYAAGLARHMLCGGGASVYVSIYVCKSRFAAEFVVRGGVSDE